MHDIHSVSLIVPPGNIVLSLCVIKRKVSKENMENNPLSWCGAPILRFDLYEILKKYIDQDYFEIVEISI